jgi:hypothetical protein
MENLKLRYGFIFILLIIIIFSLFVAIKKYKTVDVKGKTTYHISRSIGLIGFSILLGYVSYSLLIGKNIDMNMIRELKDKLNYLTNRSVTFKSG